MRVILAFFRISVGGLRQVFIVSHSYQTYFGFSGSDLYLDCGLRDHVITRFASINRFTVKKREGFKPSRVRKELYRFSRTELSITQPSLQKIISILLFYFYSVE